MSIESLKFLLIIISGYLLWDSLSFFIKLMLNRGLYWIHHDKNVKIKRTLKWLEEGNKVKVAIRFRGRQLAHVDLGIKVIDDFVEECAEVGQIEKPAKLEGRTLTAILAPKKKK